MSIVERLFLMLVGYFKRRDPRINYGSIEPKEYKMT
jgi:hypothetical protein